MKILIIDDHQLFLEGLSQILSYKMEDVDIIRANSAEQAIEKITSTPNISLALIDLMMPNVHGVELLLDIKKIDKLLPVAVLSATENLKLVKSVLVNGAQGFIPKTYPSDKLINAINILLSGDSYVPENIQLLLEEGDSRILNDVAMLDITGRQLDVLTLLAKGLSNQKIAEKLFISEHTVKSHLKKLYLALNCDNRISCVKNAEQLGLIVLRDDNH